MWGKRAIHLAAQGDLFDHGREGGVEVSHMEERLKILTRRGNYCHHVTVQMKRKSYG